MDKKNVDAVRVISTNLLNSPTTEIISCIMAWLFAEYDVARNSQVLHWNFSILRATSYSTNSPATVPFLFFVSFLSGLSFLSYIICHVSANRLSARWSYPPHPLGNFADISYLKEQSMPHWMQDVYTLYLGQPVTYVTPIQFGENKIGLCDLKGTFYLI